MKNQERRQSIRNTYGIYVNEVTGMTIKNIVVVDGKEVNMDHMEDKAAFSQSVNQRVLLDRNYIMETGTQS